MSKDKIKGGLGKGLDVLFGGNDSESRNTSPENITEMNPVHSDENILFIELGKINSNPYQPRKEFDDSELKDLAASIKQKGVIQAITVRKLENGNFELISGERRLRASKLAGIEKFPLTS